jgi:hypothetical protein
MFRSVFSSLLHAITNVFQVVVVAGIIIITIMFLGRVYLSDIT